MSWSKHSTLLWFYGHTTVCHTFVGDCATRIMAREILPACVMALIEMIVELYPISKVISREYSFEKSTCLMTKAQQI